MTEIHPDMAGNQNRLKGRLSNQKCVIKLVNRQPVHPPLYRNWVGQLPKIKLWPTKLFPLFCLASGPVALAFGFSQTEICCEGRCEWYRSECTLPSKSSLCHQNSWSSIWRLLRAYVLSRTSGFISLRKLIFVNNLSKRVCFYSSIGMFWDFCIFVLVGLLLHQLFRRPLHVRNCFSFCTTEGCRSFTNRIFFWDKYFLCLKLFTCTLLYQDLGQKNIFQLTLFKFLKKVKFQRIPSV